MSSTSWDWPGARWWRCDLHVHSPASHDFKEQHATPGEWVQAALDAHLDVVAVTDHDQAGFITAARAEAGDRLTVLAGTELTSSEGVHLLVLLGETAAEDHVHGLLGACGVPAGQWGKGEARASEPLLKCMEIAAQQGGICIAAHADAPVTSQNSSAASLLRAGIDQRTVRRILSSPYLAAVEVLGDDEGEHQKLRGLGPGQAIRRAPGLALVRFSDAHALGQIGRESTWIKMTRPTQDGLRLALCDSHHSVRPVEVGVDENDAPGWVIESLSVANAKLIGNAQPLVLGFNPWFTSIIGGFGSGKTSVLTLLRAALDRLDAPSGGAQAISRFLQIGSRNGDGALRDDTQVLLVYRKDGVRFRAKWTTGMKVPLLETQSGETWIQADGTVSGRLPAVVFGQGEIHEIAQKPQALLGIVDQSLTVSRPDWQHDFDLETAAYRTLKARIRQTEAGLAREPETRGELADIKQSLKVFEDNEHREALAAYRRRFAQREAVEGIASASKSVVSAIRAALPDTAGHVEGGEIDRDLFDTNDPADVALLDLVKSLSDSVENAITGVGSVAQTLAESTENFESAAAQSDWGEQSQKAEEAYADLVGRLRDAGIDHPDRYAELVQRQQDLEKRLATLEAERLHADGLRQEAAGCLDNVRGLRSDLSKRRTEFLGSVLNGNPRVRVELEDMRDLEPVRDDLRSLLGIDTSFDADFQKLETVLTDGGGTFVERVEKLKEYVHELAGGGGDPHDTRFRSRLESLNPEALDRVDTWFPEDRLVASYSRGDGHFEPLSRGSVGQQNAAILAFLLSYGHEPIIIDQPESDLDNRLISQLLVSQLHEIKSRRQVIVVTHNPNIVVNADAELVTCLELTAGEVHIAASGGLQEPGARTAICDVMEGGRDAFEARYSRIGERTTARAPH